MKRRFLLKSFVQATASLAFVGAISRLEIKETKPSLIDNTRGVTIGYRYHVGLRCADVLYSPQCGARAVYINGVEQTCDKTLEDCKNKFDNIQNFSGMPRIPTKIKTV